MISLHYTTVSLGTPGLKFMVALDTGSDLFWVPCDCSRCASIENTAYSVCCFTSRCVDFYLDCHFFNVNSSMSLLCFLLCFMF